MIREESLKGQMEQIKKRRRRSVVEEGVLYILLRLFI
jgi:hypothetical protein